MMKILLVEDEPEILEFFDEYLREAGYDILAISDGKAALDAIESSSAFSALITDANLPSVKGPKIAATFAKRNPNAPICVISGHLDADNLFKTEAKDIKVTIMEKPFSTKDLVAWLGTNGIQSKK